MSGPELGFGGDDSKSQHTASCFCGWSATGDYAEVKRLAIQHTDEAGHFDDQPRAGGICV